jgi:multicomponent Na+:H+ antiporter subunit G
MMHFLAIVFLVGGVLFMLLASIGFLRMPDTFMRAHVASLAPTLGKIGILLALAATFEEGSVVSKSLLIVIFLFVTAPVAAHLILRAAYHDRCPMSPQVVRDDYKEGQKDC